jgi:Leucine-rich repeat (LRR) protein
MVNLSCINTLNHSCRNLDSIPAELIENSSIRLSAVQKLDISFNNISSLEDISFEKFTSLKELMLNDNQINSALS